MSAAYPYPKLDEDGYEFEVVSGGTAGHPFAPYPIPSDEVRYAVKPGDVVKLIFLYRDHVEKNGRTFSAEHMWVRVIDFGQGCLVGRLDNSPQYSNILKVDAEVRFHPKHIIRFWPNEKID
jgi:hypothetical protein